MTQLKEYADNRGLELAAYHDACRQLRAILGTEFVEAQFAHELLTRLQQGWHEVPIAVREAFVAALEGADV
jgi:hypothetical protein